jgi:hypothetical protein
MCQSQNPDVMSEFCINENGEVYGGAPGDQTGGEAAINPFREEFDGILHYNGKADTVGTTTWKDGNYVATHTLNIREKRKGASALVCQVAKGATLKLGKFTTNSVGNVWAQVLAGDHKGRYVCVRNGKGTYVKRK